MPNDKPEIPIEVAPPTPAPTPVSEPTIKDSEKKQLKKETKALKRENDAYLTDNNRMLMIGTQFTDKSFKGMDLRAINTLLKNHKAEKEKEGATSSSNTPSVVGTPVGNSNQGKRLIDQYLSIDTVNSKIKLNAPASEIFKSFANHKEAREHWLK